VLTELEDETTLLAEGLRRGELLAPVRPWHPPALPTIPPELVARAELLLARQLELQIEIGLQHHDHPAATRTRAGARNDPAPLLLDLRA
jgi:hypothetical protein